MYAVIESGGKQHRVEEGETLKQKLNPSSLEVLENAKLENSLKDAQVDERFQFEREGYFCVDPEHSHDKPIFNRTVTLRDSWAKIEQKNS